MSTFGDIVDDVGAEHLSSLHEPETEEEPESPVSTVKTDRTPNGRDRYVVRLTQGGASRGLLTNRTLPFDDALSKKEEHNEQRVAGQPVAHIHKVSI